MNTLNKNNDVNIVKKQNVEIKERITMILKDFYFDFDNKGCIYLVDIISYIKINLSNETSLPKIKSDIYPYVAKKYDTTVQNINYSVLKAINDAKPNIKNIKFNLIDNSSIDTLTTTDVILEVLSRI